MNNNKNEKENLLLVDTKVLPDYYLQVVNTRELIESSGISISDACKEVGISRNTYYKYKDYVFKPAKERGKKAILSFHVENIVGILASIISMISSFKGNILSINQDNPIQDIAFIIITVEYNNLTISIDELINDLKIIKGVKDALILAYA